MRETAILQVPEVDSNEQCSVRTAEPSVHKVYRIRGYPDPLSTGLRQPSPLLRGLAADSQ